MKMIDFLGFHTRNRFLGIKAQKLIFWVLISGYQYPESILQKFDFDEEMTPEEEELKKKNVKLHG